MSDLSIEIIDAINKRDGRHPGFRAAHAKGICATGTFTATPAAAALATAAHMQGRRIPVTVRFSNGSGVPNAPDGSRDGRGMAVKFHLPDGEAADIVSLTLPAFFVRTPEDFLELVRLRTPDPVTGVPDQSKLAAFIAAHPEAQLALAAGAAAMPPASYSRLTYHAIHAFRWTNAAGASRYVRYRWSPSARYAALTDEEALANHPDYLQNELRERLAEGPATFRLQLQLADSGDDPDDPTRPWPDSRETVVGGQLHLTGVEDAADACDRLIFDPTRVTPGIECSNDSILLARSGAYSVSYQRRTAHWQRLLTESSHS
jgi:catalase